MKNFLKHSWFFTITAIFVFINLFNEEYLKVISSISIYFFIEFSIILIALKCGSLKLNAEVNKSDSE